MFYLWKDTIPYLWSVSAKHVHFTSPEYSGLNRCSKDAWEGSETDYLAATSRQKFFGKLNRPSNILREISWNIMETGPSMDWLEWKYVNILTGKTMDFPIQYGLFRLLFCSLNLEKSRSSLMVGAAGTAKTSTAKMFLNKCLGSESWVPQMPMAGLNSAMFADCNT